MLLREAKLVHCSNSLIGSCGLVVREMIGVRKGEREERGSNTDGSIDSCQTPAEIHQFRQFQGCLSYRLHRYSSIKAQMRIERQLLGIFANTWQAFDQLYFIRATSFTLLDILEKLRSCKLVIFWWRNGSNISFGICCAFAVRLAGQYNLNNVYGFRAEVSASSRNLVVHTTETPSLSWATVWCVRNFHKQG